MRMDFEQKAKKLAELLKRPQSYRDRLPKATLLHLPTHLPLSLTFILAVLALIALTSAFFDVLNAQVLIAMIIPNSSDAPITSFEGIVFSAHLLGITLHGLYTEVYLFLSISFSVLVITFLTIFLFIALLYRRPFLFTLLPFVFYASALLFLNAIFLQYATNHIVFAIVNGGIVIPASTHIAIVDAWNIMLDMLFPQSVSNAVSSFQIGSSYLSVGDARMYFATIAASWRWPTFLLLLLSVSAFLVARRSGSLLRWLATGIVPDTLRIRHYARYLEPKQPGDTLEMPSKQLTSWYLLYHPSDSSIADEIEVALTGKTHLCKGSAEQADVFIVLLTNHSSWEWLEELRRDKSNLLCVLCTSIRLPKSLEHLRQHQWFDYREHSPEKLLFLARSLEKETSEKASYIFPAIPENVERSIVPLSVWYKSHAMRSFAIWSLAIVLFGGGRVQLADFSNMALAFAIALLVKILYWICIPCSLYLFWLGVRLASSNISYRRLSLRLNVVMIIFWIIQFQFLGYFTNMLSLTMLASVMTAFIAIVWFVPKTWKVEGWLPARDESLLTSKDSLAVPLHRQLYFSLLIYICLFVVFYFSCTVFFAGVADLL